MSGGCAPFQVFAQGRWKPYGAALRRDPSVLSPQIGGFPANMSLAADGWVHSRPAYPTNTAPWNSDVWYHVTGGGWVSFAGVRSTPVSEDPTGLDPDGGPPAPVSDACQGAVN